MKGFVFGIGVAIAAAVAGAYFLVIGGGVPAGQDVKPGRLGKWIAKTSLRATINRQTTGLTDPLAPTDANLAAGVALYVAHCQTCHGGPDGAASIMAKGLTPTPPQLAKHGVEDDPEAMTYWKIKHGIRFTGMPAFGQALSDREIWQMTLFLKGMGSLSPSARAAWTASKGYP